ncbi:MAG TPA: YbhB/YbcL family Raf kinase inhibitor-like protein [Steroidobacteraceae bacterium]|nr:YbhB/YbcL family Raf kinase inhibitor-like protein [Steroidobacteraceae bacterium]
MLQKLPSSLGWALRGLRAREGRLVFHHPALQAVPAVIRVTSPDFADHGVLPSRYTADGAGLSPPLAWTGVPSGTESVVIFMEGADSPTPLPLVHAIEWGLAGADGELPAGALPRSGQPLRTDMFMGRNSLLTVGYLPPDPPSGHGMHQYAFEVFGLDSRVQASTQFAPGRGTVVKWLIEHAIAKGILIGLYQRP